MLEGVKIGGVHWTCAKRTCQVNYKIYYMQIGLIVLSSTPYSIHHSLHSKGTNTMDFQTDSLR